MIIKTLCIFGTRPEAIKMAPLINCLSKNTHFNNKICVTGQHQEMLNSVLGLFQIKPDFNLQVMSENQSLTKLTSKILNGLELLFEGYKPDLIFVHGDTTTTLAASLAAYYNRIDVAHVEAGLRSGNIYSPWPEEINRKLTGSIAKLHFAPTRSARLNLLKEDVNKSSIYVTGNTVIDALYNISEQLDKDPHLTQQIREQLPFIKKNNKIILVTGHRRENFGMGFIQICKALIKIATLFPDVDIVYPVHLNPNVQNTVLSMLTGIKNIYLIPPVNYLSFIYLMKCSYIVLTDSGGIQEEAPALGKPVLVMRETTERPEAVQLGGCKLIGSDTQKIVSAVSNLLLDEASYLKMSQCINAYGDGQASQNIVNAVLKVFGFHEKSSVEKELEVVTT